MANKAYSVAQGASTSLRASDLPKYVTNPHSPAFLTSEYLAAALIFPALVLIALAGFAQPEVLHHTSAKVQVMEAAR